MPWDCSSNPVLELKQSNKSLQTFRTQSQIALQPKRSGTNSESSDALPLIGTIILASFMLMHRAGTLKLHQHKTRVDCCVWNWSIWFLGDETFWQQFWEIWRVACNRYHHPGKSQGVARAGILSFITKHWSCPLWQPRVESFNHATYIAPKVLLLHPNRDIDI